MDKPELTETQKQELDEILQRASAFELLINTKGWEYIKAFYSNKVQALANGLLLNEKMPIVDFEPERQRLIGLKQLLGMIDSDLETLAKFRKDQEDVNKVK